MTEYLSIEGPADALEALAAELEGVEGLELAKPVGVDSPADALDAPISPGEIQPFLELMRTAFEAGTAGLTFWTALNAVKQRFPGAKIKVKETRTGKPVEAPETG